MNNLSFRILLVMLIMCHVFCWGQSAKYYSTDQHLSSSLVNKVLQDKRGFIWIATENGLNKFDGYNFTTYKHKSGDRQSLINNYVKTVFEDSSGTIWIGCINGLMKYDNALDVFEEIELHVGGSKVAPHITSILETKNGEKLFSTSGYGVFTIEDKEKKYKVGRKFSDILSSNFVNAAYEDIKGNVWIGYGRNGLDCFNSYSEKVTSIQIPDELSNLGINTIIGNKEGYVFIGTLNKGLYVYNPHLNKLYAVPYKESAEQLLIKSLLVKDDGEVLIGTDGQGLKSYNLSKNLVESNNTIHAPFDISKRKVHSIMQDKLNNIWLGIFQKGVIFMPNIQSGFKYLGAKSIENNPIGNSPVSAIHKDHNNTLWVGTDSDGIYGLNKAQNRVTHFTQSKNRNSVSDIILSIFEDSNNDLWIGFFAKGLAKLDRNTGNCYYIPELKNENIYAISEDNDKNLLIGSSGSGLYLLDISGSNKGLTNLRSSQTLASNLYRNELNNDWVNCIKCDKDGLIWIGHYKGLSCYNPKTKSFINYIKENNFIQGTVVLSLHEDYLGNIFAGTKEGLYYFNKKDITLSHYTVENGLSDDAVCAIVDDANHNLWLSTYNGLNKLDIKSGKITNYYAGDGIQGNEFYQGAAFKGKDGEVFFGGTYGVTHFFPEQIVPFSISNNLYVTNFYLNDSPIKWGEKSGKNTIVSEDVIDADHFTLSYNNNTFSFDLSTLDYINTEYISYQYRIEKLSPNWTTLPPGMNRITYTNMQPGDYLIDLRVFSSNGNYSNNNKQINITITPPWYQTWWAYILYIGLILLLLYGIISYVISRIKHRREIAEKEQAKVLSEEKLQFFINISHEIRTPLTLIVTPLEKLMKETNNSEIQNKYLLIYRNAQRILRLVNQIMDIRKLDKGLMKLMFQETDIVRFVDDAMDTFNLLAQKNNIHFVFNHNVKVLNVWVDPNNFDKVLLNVLSNAFKYTAEYGEITIDLSTDNNKALGVYFEIKISDTGIGIDQKEIEKIFDRFYQVSNNYSNIGTGVGLHLSRWIVELHKGTIYAENNSETTGSSFVIRLPLGRNHLKDEHIGLTNENQSIALSKKENTTPNIIEDVDNQSIVNKSFSKTKYNILLVEDDEEIRNYIRGELLLDYNISISKNGKEGLNIILREKPDLILSDIMMPEMDGISLTKKVKININISHIPIILLTAKTSIQDRLEGLETEADAYLDKPFNMDVLKHTISNLISNRERLKNKYIGNESPENLIHPIEIKSADEILLEKIMKIITDHLANPELSVQMLSDTVGLSRGHLHKKMKELTNQSVRDFIRGIRLQQAASLLISKKLSVSEVVFATGFSSLSYFSNAFKDFYGMSPTEYIVVFKDNSSLFFTPP